MRFGILGPTQVEYADGRTLAVGGPGLRALLAMLVTASGEVVTIERLVDGLYGTTPPAGAVNALRSQVARLRRLLDDAVLSHPAGYCLAVDTDDVDAHRFERLAGAGHRALDDGDHSGAVRLLGEALALWRGPALVDVGAPFAAAQAARLEERRLAAVEDRIEAELRCGNGGSMVAELRELVATDPLRERLYALLIRALAGVGRQAEALAVYADARRVLADELGTDPSPQLTDVYLAVLRGRLLAQPAEAGPTLPAGPRMLPATIGDFAGRTDDLAAIERALGEPDPARGRLAVPIVVVSGRAGAGKTSLAVHSAHSLADRFPDGQLFANLHSSSRHPVGAAQILDRLLRLLGVPGTVIPDSVDARAELYRNLLADRRVLIVLDDAGGEDDVLPLLPGSHSCAVLVTSRRRLPSLAGALTVDLGRLDPDQSVELLSRIVGGDRVRQDPDAARSLADMCGQLPLALRIAGARLATRPHWSIGQLVARLADEERRLDELVHGRMAVRTGIWLIHDALSEPARRLFRLLGAVDPHVFSAWTAAALLNLPLQVGQEHLEELVEAHLVEPARAGGVHTHYRFHDLISGFARQRLAADEPAAERSAAVGRALDALLCLSRAAARPVLEDRPRFAQWSPSWSPPVDLVDEVAADPAGWFEHEHPVIVAAVDQAARAGLPDVCWGLAMAVRHFLVQRAYHDDATTVLNAALSAVRQAGDRGGEAAVLVELGTSAPLQRRHEDARRHLTAAEAIFRELGDERGLAVALRGQAYVHYSQGRTTEAARLLEQTLASARSMRFDSETAYILQVLAHISLIHGDIATAQRLLAEAIGPARAAGNPRVVAQVLRRTGQAQSLAGESRLANSTLTEALTLARDSGDAAGEAYILIELGRTRLCLGATAEARALLDEARDRAGALHDALAEARALTALGEAALAQVRPQRAAAHFRRAADLFGAVDSQIDVVRALAALGEAQQAAGQVDAARQSWDMALRLTDRMDPIVSERLHAQIAARP